MNRSKVDELTIGVEVEVMERGMKSSERKEEEKLATGRHRGGEGGEPTETNSAVLPRIETVRMRLA